VEGPIINLNQKDTKKREEKRHLIKTFNQCLKLLSVIKMMKKREKADPGDIITFYTKDLPSDLRAKLIKLKKIKKRSQFIKDALIYWDFRNSNFKFYLIDIINSNFGLVRHLLRKIGRKNQEKLKVLSKSRNF